MPLNTDQQQTNFLKYIWECKEANVVAPEVELKL